MAALFHVPVSMDGSTSSILHMDRTLCDGHRGKMGEDATNMNMATYMKPLDALSRCGLHTPTECSV
jgi:hypothetical protein